VTNGTFDTDVSGWTAVSSVLSVDSGSLVVTNNGATNGSATQSISTTSGSVYLISGEVAITGGNLPRVEIDGVNVLQLSASGAFSVKVVAGSSSVVLGLKNNSTTASLETSWDNISVREINPLSVSIQMDGRMTYADENSFGTVTLFRWYDTASNYVLIGNDTDSTDTGEINFRQISNGVQDITNLDAYSPDVFVPFNVAMRNGSTFVNGAVDGVAATVNTNPVALPDLSSTDLQLGFDYNGTIKTFRVWSQDLGDTGIVEATEPSLEPSLSLTFDSTDSSFIVRDFT